MSHKEVLILVLLAITTTLWAVPAKKVKKTIFIDGKTVEVTLTGDERLHYWLADDGTAYKQLSESSFELLDVREARKEMSSLLSAPLKENMTRTTASNIKNKPITGNRRGLVILVNTTDIQFSCSEDPRATFDAMMNEPGFNIGTAKASVRDYFLAQSYGKLDYQFDVVGPVTVSHEMAYYGNNKSYTYEACAVGEMIVEAISLVDDEVDFSLYDVDGDGEVENIYVIYAGYAESQGAVELIWPHAYELRYINYFNKNVTPMVCDGVKVDSYACSSEFRDTKGGKIDGIGTICHEFSHCLGLPDYYNTNDASQYTLGYWSVLDRGCYNDDGDTPPSYFAHERWACGWITPEELSSDTIITNLRNLDDSGDAYIYYNEANKNEYYLVQNIQKTGWNAYVKGHGLAIFHVDYDANKWRMNEVNNDPTHLCMSMFVADNSRSYLSEAGDLYPNKNNNALTETTNPAATVFKKNVDDTMFMGKNLTDITEYIDGEISFTFSLSESLKEATAIEEITISQPEETILYNIIGQRVPADYRGLIISNGKKRIVTY